MHVKNDRNVYCNCAQGRPDPAAAIPGPACSIGIRTVSHTLEGHLAERLRFVAFRERVSESAVLEFALRELLGDVEDGQLGERMRRGGATLRRKAR